MRFLTTVAALILAASLLLAQNKEAHQPPNLDIRIEPAGIISGIPEAFTFTFVNISDHEVRMPKPSQCAGLNGTIKLRLDITPPPLSGVGGGCMGMEDHPLKGLDRVKQWKALKPGESLTVTLSRRELFHVEDEPGSYGFWVEYDPPPFSAQDQLALTQAGIDVPNARLIRPKLKFERKQ